MKKNFRFFDNRQKYLLFVTTTNEKNKIADALKPIVQKLKPKYPALKIFDAGMGDGSLIMSIMRQCHQRMPNIPLLVTTKEISLEDVRLGLEKLPDRFVEHKNTVFIISNLNYIEGKTVSILADGAVHPQRVVSSGSVTLERAASVVHVGLEYNSDHQSLPLALQVEAFGQGRVKNLNHVWLRVLESSGIFAGPSSDKLIEAKQRTTEPYGSPPSLKTEDIKIMLTPSWQDYGQIFIRQTDPLPLAVVGITLEVSVGG